MSKCNHNYVKLVAKVDDELIPLKTVRACTNCGELKIGTETITITENWLDMDAKPIRNVNNIEPSGSRVTVDGDLEANHIYGTVHYADIHFQEKECAICEEKFKEGDKITLWVRKVTDEGISLIPAHQECKEDK